MPVSHGKGRDRPTCIHGRGQHPERGREKIMTPDGGVTDEYYAYVGTYTWDDSEGIYAFRITVDRGEWSPIGVTAAGENPSFLATHPTGEFLYAVNEVEEGTVTAFAIDRASGTLSRINQASTGDAGPCHCSVDRTGSYVLVAHYAGGSVSALPIQAEGGVADACQVIKHEGSSIDPKRQTQPRPHSIVPGPGNRFVYVPDLGTDRLVIYPFEPHDGPLDAHGSEFVSVHPGAGPRHFDVHPSGESAYLINEMDSTLTAFERNQATGRLSEIATVSTLPRGNSDNNSTADVHVHPDGGRVFGSNRGHDSIAVFRLETATETPELVTHVDAGGETPRHFGLDPFGRSLFVLNQDSNNIIQYVLEQHLDPVLGGKVASVPRPVCLVLTPAVESPAP